MSDRALVRWLPNERADMPDFTATERNSRSNDRAGWAHFLFGPLTTGSDARRVLDGWEVVEDSGGPSAVVEVAYGSAVGAETVPSGSDEYGVWFGEAGETMQTVDFTGQPANTYTIYVRHKHELGDRANRVFFNDATDTEEVDSMETRYKVVWDVTLGTASPGIEWEPIAEVVWNGSSISNSDITMSRNYLFEGQESFVTGYAYDATPAWGSGANDRDGDRAQYGIKDFATWVSAIRRQFRDVIDSDGSWYDAVPQTAVNDPGENADLVLFRDHYDTVTDPHGDSPTWTGTVSANKFEQSGLVSNIAYTGTKPIAVQYLSFTDLVPSPAYTEPTSSSVLFEYGPTDVAASPSDLRFCFFPTGSNDQPLIANLNSFMRSLNSGSTEISTITVFAWTSGSTGAASAIHGVRITLQARKLVSTVDGAWTDEATGFVDVDTVYGSGNPAQTCVLSPSFTPDSDDTEIRLKIEVDNAGTGDHVYIAGVAITYRPSGLYPM